MTWMNRASQIAAIIIGISGWRLDLGHKTLRLLALIVGVLFFWSLISLATPHATERAYIGATAAWFLYYGGMVLVFRTPLAQWSIARWGEEKAYRLFTIVLGIAFLIQALSQTVLISVFENTLVLGIPSVLIKAVALCLTVIGFTTKIWATYLTGLDTYYYKDLFVNHVIRHEKSRQGYVTKGPYRLVSNPMYGVGNLQAYGAALWSLSLEGLLCAGVFQATVYIIYFWIEKPFFMRAYLNKD